MPRRDCVIYRDKPLPREAFWRTTEQAPPVWLPARSAPPENVWLPVTLAPSPPFPLPPKSAPSIWVLIGKVLALGALLLCFLLRKATEPPAPRAQLVKLPPQLIMPDNSIVKVSYHGELANETLFTQPVPPRTPNRLGDTFLIQKLRIAAIDQFTNEHKVPPITLRPDQCVARTVCSDAHRRHRLLLPAPASVKCTFIVFTFAHKIVSLTSQSDAGTKDVQ